MEIFLPANFSFDWKRKEKKRISSKNYVFSRRIIILTLTFFVAFNYIDDNKCTKEMKDKFEFFKGRKEFLILLILLNSMAKCRLWISARFNEKIAHNQLFTITD